MRFLKEMIDHHHVAVMMGEMAVEKAVHPQLAELGEAIVKTQTAEIEQMQEWLGEWYGIEYEPRMTTRDAREMAVLEKLEGEAFEVEWLGEMVQHHMMAAMMSQSILQRAKHQELKGLARQIIETQTAEIEQMQDWLSEWYDIEHGGMGGGMHGGGRGDMHGGMGGAGGDGGMRQSHH